MRKVLGMVEGEQSEGYLVDAQNTSLYLVRCQWRAGRVYRRSKAEVVLWVTKGPVEAWHFRTDFDTWYLSFLRWCSTELYFSFPHRWVQQTAPFHLPQPITAMSSGAVCLLLDFLMS